MFVLKHHITIEDTSKKLLKGVSEVKIERSIKQYIDTASIVVPTICVLNDNGTRTTSNISQQIKRGDKVSIQLGYNDTMNTEFVGFVNRLIYGKTTTLECENYAFQLRDKEPIKDSFKSIELKDLLNKIIESTDIQIGDCDSMKIERFFIDNKSRIDILDYIKTKLLMEVYFVENKLFVKFLANLQNGNKVNYKLNWNTLNDGNLKPKNVSDENIQVKLKVPGQKKEMPTIVATAGNKDGAVKYIKVSSFVKDQKYLQAIADSELKKLSYTGYEGSITSLLLPFAQPLDIANITDEQYNERSGQYQIVKTNTTFNHSGARRTVEIGLKID